MRPLKRRAGIAAVALAICTVPATAYGSEPPDPQGLEETVHQLVEANPGTTAAEMLEAITSTAANERRSAEDVASTALAEIQALKNPDAVSERSGKPKANRPIGPARNRGDIFYSPSSTAGVPHGHSGIYYRECTVIDSTPSKGVSLRNCKDFKVPVNTQIQRVSTLQKNRDSAALKARQWLGRGYNYNFAFNKTANGKMNCSQLVWAAYKVTSGIDLDSNGGHGVYPVDILKSKLTRTYRTIK